MSALPSPSIEKLTTAFVAGFRSAQTRSNYAANLRDWFAWTEITATGPWQTQRRDVEAYVGRLEEAGYAPNTICQRIATLSSFYRWAVAEDHLTRNPVEGARRPRKPAESTAQGLSRHEVTDWLDAAEGRGGSAYACACLLALNGLRVGQFCATNIDDRGEPTWHHTLTPAGRDHQGRQGRRHRPRRGRRSPGTRDRHPMRSPGGVLVPVGEYEALEETAEILSDETARWIRRGLADLAAGDEVPLQQVRDEHADRNR